MALFSGRLMIILRKRNGFVPQVQLANRKFSMKPEDEKADGQHNVDKIWIPSWLRSLIVRPIGYPYNIGVDFQEGSNCHYYDVPKEMYYDVLDRAISAEKKLAKKEEQLAAQTDILASVAPIFLRVWIEDCSVKLLASRLINVKSTAEMISILGFSAEDLDRKTRKAIERAEKNLNYRLTDELRLKLTQEYVNWRFILAKMNDNDEVKVFRQLMETYGINNDEDLATEMSFLDVKTSVFIGHSATNMDKITLEVLLRGLKMYGWAYPNTKKAVCVLYKFVRGETED